MTSALDMIALPTPIEHRIRRGEGDLSVREFPGTEPVFVLLHGFPDNSHIYDRLIPLLCKTGRRVIAIDFLGFGSSSKPVGFDYNFQQQLGDLEATVEQLGLERIIPVAHDAGGPAAVNFALKHPERTAAVTMINCVYDDAPGLIIPEIVDFFSIRRLKPLHDLILSDPQVFGWLFGYQRQEMQNGLTQAQKSLYTDFLGPIIDQNMQQEPSAAQAFVSMVSHLTEELSANSGRLALLRKCDVPFCFIWGKLDPYLHVSMAEHMRAQTRRGELHVLSAGHWPQIDAASETAEIMVKLT